MKLENWTLSDQPQDVFVKTHHNALLQKTTRKKYVQNSGWHSPHNTGPWITVGEHQALWWKTTMHGAPW